MHCYADNVCDQCKCAFTVTACNKIALKQQERKKAAASLSNFCEIIEPTQLLSAFERKWMWQFSHLDGHPYTNVAAAAIYKVCKNGQRATI